jgi:hypothetical protein
MSECKHCGKTIDRKALETSLSRLDIRETAKRAASASVFCSYLCAFEDFAKLAGAV